jgi:flagellar biosynthesis component FlhA
MKELKKAQMGMIAILTVMLVSMKRRLPTRRFSSGITTTLALAVMVLLVAAGTVSAADCGTGIAVCACGDTVRGQQEAA